MNKRLSSAICLLTTVCALQGYSTFAQGQSPNGIDAIQQWPRPACPPHCALRGLGYSRGFILQNGSSQSIIAFYASNTGESRWQEILRGSILQPGESIDIKPNTGTSQCHVDFKTVMQSGQVVIQRNVDVCAEQTFTIHNQSKEPHSRQAHGSAG
jgi:hypothetical protein